MPPLFAWRILDFKLWEKLAALATVAVGVTGAVIGSYQAIKAINEALAK